VLAEHRSNSIWFNREARLHERVVERAATFGASAAAPYLVRTVPFVSRSMRVPSLTSGDFVAGEIAAWWSAVSRCAIGTRRLDAPLLRGEVFFRRRACRRGLARRARSRGRTPVGRRTRAFVFCRGAAATVLFRLI
jgi:hypothetical protein